MENESKTTSSSFRLFFLMLVFLLLDPLTAIREKDYGNQRSIKEKKLNRKKLFVFGDSYGDTGNWKEGTGVSWELPYGSTFPGKPTGRFSDGRILTDFIASYLGIGSPVPYTQRRSPSSARKLKFGMNFAYGGTGVFDTDVSQPNMTTQIDFFQNVLESESGYTRHDLESSIALDIERFTKSVVDQLVSNLKRIHSLGVSKVAVTGLEPLGCLPAVTSSTSYRNCSDTINGVAALHNQILKQSVTALNKQTGDVSFFVLDLYAAFISGLNTYHQQLSGLNPCCEGVSGRYGCGSRDEGNQTKYTVCAESRGAFFWDSVHPSQHGWQLVFFSLKSSLKLLN
ncbi:hypothetical protein V2J09_019153 [Rumex salicifolius]